MTELSKRPNYRADIQGLRGVAVLLVVLFHAGLPVSGGFIGVDVFFVISGFVIAQGIVRGLEKGTFSFRTFYVKRMRRLLPALTVTLSTVMALLLLLGPPVAHKISGRTGVAAALFNANHYLLRGPGYFDAATEYNAFLHTWSLSVEEQFYFAFPLMLFILWRIGRAESGRARVIWGIGIGSALSLIVSFWLSYTQSVFGFNGQSLAFYTVVSRAWQFGVGALISLGAARLSKTPLANVHLVWVGLAMIVTGSFLFDGATVFPGVAVLLPTFGAALVITAGLQNEGTSYAARLLRSRGMVRLGDLSYSWYLWHWPLIVFAAATFPHVPLQASIIAAVVSLGVAVLNERYVETPIRFRPKARQWPALAMFVLCVATPVGVWGVTRAANAEFVTRAASMKGGDSFVAQPMRMQAEYTSIGCDGTETPNAALSRCRWGEGAAQRVHLIGDSNARQWIPMLRELVPSMGLSLTATTLSACPFVDVTLYDESVKRSACAEWVQASLKELVADPPDLVIIANAADNYVYDKRFVMEEPDAGALAVSLHEKLAAYHDGTVRIVEALENSGAKVLLVAPVPKFRHAAEGANWLTEFSRRREKAFVARCSLLADFSAREL